MIWRDVIINRNINNSTLMEVLAKVFNLTKFDIDIADSLEGCHKNKSVICILTELSGSFCLMLTFYLTIDLEDENAVITELCRQLNCEVLISNDESNNPYSMILIDKNGVFQEVEVDSDKLDDYEEYELLEKIKIS
jgi:hypothetical protein